MKSYLMRMNFIELKSIVTFMLFIMLCIKLSLLFFTLCFTTVDPKKYSRSHQIHDLEYLTKNMKCWKNKEVLSRKVPFKEGKMSINDFFMSSATDLIQDWPIKENNVNDLYHLMATVLSCEYSEFVYKIFEFIRTRLIECENIKPNIEQQTKTTIPNYQNQMRPIALEYYTCAYDVFLCINSFKNNIVEMILTLEAFIEFRVDYESSKLDIFKIFLSTYLHMNHKYSLEQLLIYLKTINDKNQMMNNTISEISNFIKTIDLLRKQTTIALKEFNIKNCRSVREFNVFTGNISPLPKHENGQIFGIIYQEISKNGANIRTVNVNNPNILTKRVKHEQLLKTLQLNTNIKVSWNTNKLSIDEIYEKYIKNSMNIQTILKYDYEMFKIITGLVYRRVLEELRPMIYQDYDGKKCEFILSTFSEFLSKLESSNYSVVFVGDMIELNYRLSSIIPYLKSSETRRQAEISFEQLLAASKVVPGFNKCWTLPKPVENNDLESEQYETVQPCRIYSLQDFLNEFVLDQINNTYLNPIVTNILFKKSYLVISGPFENVFNYKTIHTTWTKFPTSKEISEESQKFLCDIVISELLKVSEETVESIQKCKDDVEKFIISPNKGHVFNVKLCIEKFSTSLLKLLNRVVNTFDKVYTYDFIEYQTRKLVLTLTNYVTYSQLFDEKTQLIVINERLGYLLTFYSVFNEQIKMFQLFQCESSVILMNSGPKEIIGPLLNVDNSDLMNCVRKNYDKNFIPKTITYQSAQNETDILPEMTSIEKFTKFIATHNDVFDGSTIRFYWDGKQINMLNVKADFVDNIFDLQDLVERQYMTIKWIMSWLFSMFVNVLNSMIDFGVTHANFDQNCFLKRLNYLSSLRLEHFTYRPITFIINAFINIINDGGELLELKNLKAFINWELNVFGVISTTLPRFIGKNISEYINEVCNKISKLESTESDFSGLIDTVGLKLVLTGFPYSHGHGA